MSKIYKVNRGTIQRLVHRINEEGVQGLLERSRIGRPRGLSDKAMLELKGELEKPPSSLGYKQGR